MKDFVPSKEEKKKLEKEVKLFLDKFKGVKDIKFFVGGSYAKDTWLPGNRDVDIFAKFKYKKYLNEDISAILYVVLRERFKDVEVVHGSRDYFHIIVNDLLFEVVPVLDIKKVDDAMNVMDVSPLHVKYVKKHLKKKNDVRLLKALLKAQKLYGAESYVKGFSGYVLELLISYYGSFEKLIKNARKWDLDRVVIDPAKHYRSKELAVRMLNKSKISALVLIDPVQKDRNAAAGLSLRNYRKFIKLCKEYDGSEKWFVSKKVDVSKLKNYLVLEVEALDGKKDVVLAKMSALVERIKREFELNDFVVKDYGWDENYFWFKVGELSRKYKHYGPKLDMKEHVEKFKKKYKNVKVEKGRVYVELERKFYDPRKFLGWLIKKDFVKEKVKKIKILDKT